MQTASGNACTNVFNSMTGGGGGCESALFDSGNKLLGWFDAATSESALQYVNHADTLACLPQ